MKLCGILRRIVALFATIGVKYLALAELESNVSFLDNALQFVDVSNDNRNFISLELTIVPRNLKNENVGFCAHLGTRVWVTDEELENCDNMSSLFQTIRDKMAKRVFSGFTSNNVKRLSALAYLALQGNVGVIENNVQQDMKELRVVKGFQLSVVSLIRWNSLAYNGDGFHFSVGSQECDIEEPSYVVDIEEAHDRRNFFGIAFPEMANLDVDDRSFFEKEENTVITELNDDEPKENEEASSQAALETEPKDTLESAEDSNAVEAAVEEQEPAKAEEAKDTTELENDQELEDDEVVQDREVTDQEDTKYMDMLKDIDEKDANEGTIFYAVKLRIRTHLLTRNSNSHKDMETTNVLMLSKDELESCQNKDFVTCVRTIREKLMKRYETPEIKDFVRGRFYCLLQALMLQYNVNITWYNKSNSGVPKIDIFLSSYNTSFVNLFAWQPLLGFARSTNRELEMSMNFQNSEYKTELHSKGTDVYLGIGYSESKYERLFAQEFQSLGLERQMYESHTDERINMEKPARHIEIYTPSKSSSHNSKQALQLMLESTERQLLQVPKDFKGYSISFSTAEEYRELKRIWEDVLISMGMMKKGDVLKDVLENTEFSYDQLKEFFRRTYAIIANDTYEANKAFYEAANIKRHEVASGIQHIQNAYRAYSGVGISRLPPVIKHMRNGYCHINEMIVSLTTEEVIERVQIILSETLRANYKEPEPENNYHLAVICSAAGVFVQNWAHMQSYMNYNTYGSPWATLLTSFSTMGHHRREDVHIKKEFKVIIKSKAADICRNYISLAGDVANTSYKNSAEKTGALSLTGAVGNLLDLKMNSEASKIATAMEDYFQVVKKEKRIGACVGLCLTLQIMERLNRCFNVEKSNDYFTHRLQMLTQSTFPILEHFMSTNEELKTDKVDAGNFVLQACDPRDTVVEDVIKKFFSIVSVDGPSVIREILNSRHFKFPVMDGSGNLVDQDSEFSIAGDEVVLHENKTGTVDVVPEADRKLAVANTMPESFLQISEPMNMYEGEILVRKHALLDIINLCFDPDSLEEEIHEEADITPYEDIINRFTRFGYMYPDDMRTINFEFRVISKYDPRGPLNVIRVPFKFHPEETIYLKHMNNMQFIRLLMRKIAYRMIDTKRHVPVHDLLQHFRSLAALENKKEITMSISRNIIDANNQLNQYKRLLAFLEDLASDGYYLEDGKGTEYLPRLTVPIVTGMLADKRHDNEAIVFHFIEPVSYLPSDQLFMG